jgi:hypothetical protein
MGGIDRTRAAANYRTWDEGTVRRNGPIEKQVDSIRLRAQNTHVMNVFAYNTQWFPTRGDDLQRWTLRE